MSAGSRKKRLSAAGTVSGLPAYGLPPLGATPAVEELVAGTRTDAPLPVAEVDLLTLDLPEELDLDDPWAGIEEELTDEDDPWADYAAEAAADPDGGATKPASEA